MIKIFIVAVLLVSGLVGADKLFFLPNNKKDAVKEIENQLKNAKESIDIAMYNLSYQRFNRLLDEASQRGVKVKVFYYKKKADFVDGVETIKIKDKLHVKMAIIDKKTVIFGSANWSDETFEENYEVIYISDKTELVQEFNKFYQELDKNKRNQVNDKKK